MTLEPRHILFLCTGNYYRSRFAEALFNHEAAKRGLPWRATSRGLAIHLIDGDLSSHTVEAMQARGIDPSCTGPTRVRVTAEDITQADRVIALKDDEHRPMVEEQFPDLADKVEYWNVDDLGHNPTEDPLLSVERQVEELLRQL